MQFNPYGGSAARLASELVNAGPEARAPAFEEILDRLDYQPRRAVRPDDAASLVEWAGRLREVFREATVPGRVALVNTLLGGVAAAPYISQHDGRAPHFHYAEVDAPLVERVKAYTAAGLAHAICEDPNRIGGCARPGCPVVYVDTSRNGRRRYCSTRCANRTHVADHRARRRA
ncbi:CGNR zinc finger domain-containing protein [Pseudonocardia eucalypti]|uniref:CGNR zinc finger domain-containing protein n=1 Tax=Pseudonocardia eucalypti TaxID=648755 RepID=A0ABP9PIM3_9PSEU|nr:putative RNA-binding Zn ribbon-like protein [Pseudonocardia eucalypti]